MNRLLFSDNLGWLRDPKEIPDASVDLVYLDQPFNSNADDAIVRCGALQTSAKGLKRRRMSANPPITFKLFPPTRQRQPMWPTAERSIYV